MSNQNFLTKIRGFLTKIWGLLIKIQGPQQVLKLFKEISKSSYKTPRFFDKTSRFSNKNIWGSLEIQGCYKIQRFNKKNYDFGKKKIGTSNKNPGISE